MDTEAVRWVIGCVNKIKSKNSVVYDFGFYISGTPQTSEVQLYLINELSSFSKTVQAIYSSIYCTSGLFK